MDAHALDVTPRSTRNDVSRPLALIREAVAAARAVGRVVRCGQHGVRGSYRRTTGKTEWSWRPVSSLDAGISPIGAVLLGRATVAEDLYRAAAEVLGVSWQWLEGLCIGTAGLERELWQWATYSAEARAAAIAGRDVGEILAREIGYARKVAIDVRPATETHDERADRLSAEILDGLRKLPDLSDASLSAQARNIAAGILAGGYLSEEVAA